MRIKNFKSFINENYNIPEEEELVNTKLEDEEKEEEDEVEEEEVRHPNFAKYDNMLQGRNFEKKKLDNNTYAHRKEDGSIGIRLHNTDVVTFYPNGDFKLNSGGWHTMTTKDRINNFVPNGYHISQKNYIWTLHTPQGSMEFKDNMLIKR